MHRFSSALLTSQAFFGGCGAKACVAAEPGSSSCNAGPGAVRTPIWDKAQSADVSAYEETIYAAPLAKFVAHMVREGKESEHTPEFVARQVDIIINRELLQGKLTSQ